MADIGDGTGADKFAIAEHGVAVGDAKDLVELVADEEDRLALGLELFDQRVKLGDFLVRQGGGGFVHDHDAGIGRQRAGDGDEVFAGNAKVTQPGVGVERGFDLVQQGGGLFDHGAAVDQAETAARGMAEEDVFGNGQLVKQHGFLVDRGDACACGLLRIGKAARLAVKQDRAAVGLIDPSQDFHHSGLARAIFANQSGDLPGIELQRHAAQSAHAGEGLGHAIQRENRQRRGGQRAGRHGVRSGISGEGPARGMAPRREGIRRSI